MKPVRRLIKTELPLPPRGPARLVVVAVLVLGGVAALAMTTLFGVYLLESLRAAGKGAG